MFDYLYQAMSNAQIHITLKPALLDTQGATVLKALQQLGHGGVRDVRIGKLIEVRLDDALPPAQQQAELETMCRQLLANPVIEDFSIVLSDPTAANGQSSTRNAAPIVATIATTATTLSSATLAPASSVTETTLTASPTNPVVNVVPALMPVSNVEPLGSEPTAIAEPFAVSYATYTAMTTDERLDLQGRAWNLHGSVVMNELNTRRAAWLVWCGNRVLESGETLDSLPTDAQLTAWGAQTDLVPFVFTRPPA